MTILDCINGDVLVNEMYYRIDEYDFVTLVKYICKCNNISSEEIMFMYDNGIYLSYETIIKGVRELFGEDFYIKCVNSLARLN